MTFHSACGKVQRNPADKNDSDRHVASDCGKRFESPSVFRMETRSFAEEGTAILSKPLQWVAAFFRTHPLLLPLRIKDFVLKEETWS
ncbi:MAG: hypothetical protein ACRD3J_08420 [Thermoanaerobaculia bacterium]